MDPVEVIGHMISHSYNAGYICLSILISFVGCLTTLELLHRRTSASGRYNWYLLITAAVSMGAVAIWCMHFVGNRAISMADGEPGLQIAYSDSYTAGSFFLAICVVILAFYLFAVSEYVSLTILLLGGTLTGAAVCGMHYVGQGGISNYTPVYRWPYILGSAIIAVLASTLALGLFFYFRSTWTNGALKRAACAAVLSLAVSGMHWVASVGTAYRLKANFARQHQGLSRTGTIAVGCSLTLGCCLTLILIAIVSRRMRRRSANRVQAVVLACAVFDSDGNLMVTRDGHFPCRKITNSYLEKSFDDIFCVSHDAFCWIYRASRCWHGVADLIPNMRAHLKATNFIGNSMTMKYAALECREDYSRIFRELFCVAAEDLAAAIAEPLQDLGILYEDIMSTGTVSRSVKAKVLSTVRNPTSFRDPEKGQILGRGQLLFVVRQTNKQQTARLKASGFRFAIPENVEDGLARSIQVTREDLSAQLINLREYAGKDILLEPGIRLAILVMCPLLHGGFQVLVHKTAKHILPGVPIQISELHSCQLKMLKRMDGWTLRKCYRYLGEREQFDSQNEYQFAGQLYQAISRLKDHLASPFIEDARLTARPLPVPCRNVIDAQKPGQGILIAFRLVTDIHEYQPPNNAMTFVPLRFFMTQQQVAQDMPNQEMFAHKIQRDFPIPSLDGRTSDAPSLSKHRHSKTLTPVLSRLPRQICESIPSPTSPRWNLPYSSRTSNSHLMRGDSSSEKSSFQRDTADSSNNNGGIHVSNDITVEVSERPGTGNSSHVEMADLGVSSQVAVTPSDCKTYLDELVALTAEERRGQAFLLK